MTLWTWAIITWNPASDPDPDDNAGTLKYGLRLSEDSLFFGFVYNDTTAAGIVQIQPVADLDDNSHYYYQVKTIDDGCLSSGWSTTQNFWTNHYNYPPEPFPLISPQPAISRVDYYSYFKWRNTVDYDPMSNFTYAFQYSFDSLFGGFNRTIYGLTDTALTIETDSLSPYSQHVFWRALAIDDDSLIRVGGSRSNFARSRLSRPAMPTATVSCAVRMLLTWSAISNR